MEPVRNYVDELFSIIFSEPFIENWKRYSDCFVLEIYGITITIKKDQRVICVTFSGEKCYLGTFEAKYKFCLQVDCDCPYIHNSQAIAEIENFLSLLEETVAVKKPTNKPTAVDADEIAFFIIDQFQHSYF